MGDTIDLLDLGTLNNETVNGVLTMLGSLEHFFEPRTKYAVRIPTHKIAAYMYAPGRYAKFCAQLRHQQPLEPVELITYSLRRARVERDYYYLPQTEWHGVLAARDLGIKSVPARIVGSYPVNLDDFFLDRAGLWISGLRSDNIGTWTLRKSRSEISPQALAILTGALGIPDLMPQFTVKEVDNYVV